MTTSSTSTTKKYGSLIGVSLGPGDPDLITRAAWSQLKRTNTTWAYPIRSNKTNSYALDIAQRAGLTIPAKHQPLLFPMTSNSDKLARSWNQAATTLLPILHSGQDVLFLVQGDASTYSTFGHLARTLNEMDDNIKIQTIAGVNSFSAACTKANIALAEQDDTIAVIPAAYGVATIDKLLQDFDTLVLMKIKPLLDELLDWLQQRNLLAHASFIERVGATNELVLQGTNILQLYGTKVNYLSLLIIKNPNRIRGKRIKGCLKKSSLNEHS